MYNIKLAGNLSLSINNNNRWKKNKQFSSDMWSHHKCWYELILSTARRLRKVYKFVVSMHELIAQQGRNLSCEYFYRSLGCPQLTSSSCDVRVHFRVARQCYFKCKCKCCGTLSSFIQKCVLRRLFTVKTLLFPKICVHLWIHVTLRQTNNELVLSPPIDVIKDWFQLHPSIRRRTPEWIKTKIMQIRWLWNTLLS